MGVAKKEERREEKEKEKSEPHPPWKLQSRLGHYREAVSKNKGISDLKGVEGTERGSSDARAGFRNESSVTRGGGGVGDWPLRRNHRDCRTNV